MKTSAATAPDLARSVIAVPPLARFPNLELNSAANRALIRHLEEGGVTTLLYGGNANFYNVGIYEYAAILAFLEQAVAVDSWVIPFAGPDFGKLFAILPPLSNVDAEHHAAVRAAAQALLAHDHALSRAPATVSPA